jgi:NAD(P)-dependent dehydrogenase (short-subunit alcohol dehydrogenase family)
MPHATLDLTGRHVVVTGGAGALGTPVVARLLAAGATCHVPCIDDGPGARGLPGVDYSPRVELTDESSAAAYYAALPDVWASIHLAGGFAWAKLEDTTLATVRAQLDMNAVTAFLCCREAVKKMRARKSGGDIGGRLINVSSRGGTRPDAGLSAYAMGKAAVTALTLGLAAELRPESIWVNAIIPAIIDTPANRAAMPEADFSRWAKPADIAETILFLASPSNAVTTGALVPVDGPTA